jgi:hypothetical protein
MVWAHESTVRQRGTWKPEGRKKRGCRRRIDVWELITGRSGGWTIAPNSFVVRGCARLVAARGGGELEEEESMKQVSA